MPYVAIHIIFTFVNSFNLSVHPTFITTFYVTNAVLNKCILYSLFKISQKIIFHSLQIDLSKHFPKPWEHSKSLVYFTQAYLSGSCIICAYAADNNFASQVFNIFNQNFTIKISIKTESGNLPFSKNQLGPRYEGQLILMAEPIPHPKRPPRTPSRRSSVFASDGRAETDS